MRVKRSELVGKTQSKIAVLESIVCANALIRSGDNEYNNNGKLDDVGFEKVSAKFVDNFILKVLVPEYNTKKIKGKRPKNMFVGSQNKTIRELIVANGMEKCS